MHTPHRASTEAEQIRVRDFHLRRAETHTTSGRMVHVIVAKERGPVRDCWVSAGAEGPAAFPGTMRALVVDLHKRPHCHPDSRRSTSQASVAVNHCPQNDALLQ
ncbi:hypothetical protein SCOCK_140020 [Actinacidiphila cocklensis]|uniref:Uncharacterized protein n=1 Tax=Actinacidiphila cocklensis TaxID=887465 RepID=A0A9W4DKG9_9ACTN|nr:hypothetical protein SCOCK_140020 [Actinacidiphila cocklensis]